MTQGTITRAHDPGCVHQSSLSMKNEKAQPVSQGGQGDWDGTECVKLLRKCQTQTSAMTVRLALGLFVSEVFPCRMGVLDDVTFLRE